MTQSKGFERNQRPWKPVEQMLGMRLPNLNTEHLEKIIQDPGWVGKYVQDVLKKALPADDVFTTSSKEQEIKETDVTMFETHRSIIVRIPVPKEINAYRLRVYLGPNQLRLEGLQKNKSKTIPLSTNVSIRGSRAKYKDSVLEIRMPKDEIKASETQIEIQYD